jgi:predicted O-linked N-acetylglucosamine transferase (SPINDLY family)
VAKQAAAQVQSTLLAADKLRLAGELDQAEKLVRELLRKVPKNGRAWLILAKLHAARRELPAAEQAYRQVIEAGAGAFEARVNLGILLAQRGALQEALAEYRAALLLEPAHALALRNYGGLLRNAGELNESIAVLTRSLKLAPDDAGAHTNLGLALSSLGHHERAVAHLEHAVQLAPRELLYHDNLLLLMHYSSELGRDAIFQAHQRYGRVVEQLLPVLPRATLQPLPGRPLRVGFVSADFRRHSVAFFLEPLLEAIDRQRFSLIAYSDVRQEDEVSARLKPHFALYRDVTRLDDAGLARQIREDAIDVLIDLAGHTHGNRLAAFAYKPAPVQVTYLGYPNTTGLAGMDYRISDAWADPEGAHDAIHSERLQRLASGFLCYRPIAGSPEVAPIPSASAPGLTFGSFNALAKISDRTLSLWSALLSQVPEARLLIKHSFLTHPDSRRSFEQRLREQRIDLERVILQGQVATLEQHLAAYAQVDVALDTFPYHGTTTTCDALWMGVPVVTLAGDSHVSRVGVSLLSRLGLADLISSSAEAYVSTARDLARAGERRAQLRGELRTRMHQAGLTDAQPLARAFERALLEAYAERTAALAGT